MQHVAEPIALVDMDGTLCDYDGAMREGLAKIANPSDAPLVHGPGDDGDPPWIEARKKLIKSQVGWWRNLHRLSHGFDIVNSLRKLYFDIHILTKGPWSTTSAWTEKVEWCRLHVPFAQVHITEDKGIVYGKVLVDDWPPYIQRWRKWRPRGLVIMPAQPWNEGAFADDPNVIRYDGRISLLLEIQERLWEVRQTACYTTLDFPDFIRASGDVACPECGDLYRKHPYDLAALDVTTRTPWLHVLCDGTRVKL